MLPSDSQTKSRRAFALMFVRIGMGGRLLENEFRMWSFVLALRVCECKRVVDRRVTNSHIGTSCSGQLRRVSWSALPLHPLPKFPGLPAFQEQRYRQSTSHRARPTQPRSDREFFAVRPRALKPPKWNRDRSRCILPQKQRFERRIGCRPGNHPITAQSTRLLPRRESGWGTVRVSFVDRILT